MATADNLDRIRELVAELTRLAPEGLPTQLVVAEGVVATVIAGLVEAHGLEPAYLLELASQQIAEMVETSLALHPLN